jgi:hypothetical protein
VGEEETAIAGRAAVLIPAGQPPAEWAVPLRPLCAYLGLSWRGQLRRTRRDPVLGPTLRRVRPPADPQGGPRAPAVLCLPLAALPGWLVGLDATRLPPAVATTITRYRVASFRRLWEAHVERALPAVLGTEPRLGELAHQVNWLTGSATLLREHMSEVVSAAGATTLVTLPLDRLLGLLDALPLSAEDFPAPAPAGAPLSVEQRREIQTVIEGLVRATRAGPVPLTYAGIYLRLQQRFQLGSYTALPAAAFTSLLAELQEELQQARSADPRPPTPEA